MTTLLQGPL